MLRDEIKWGVGEGGVEAQNRQIEITRLKARLKYAKVARACGDFVVCT